MNPRRRILASQASSLALSVALTAAGVSAARAQDAPPSAASAAAGASPTLSEVVVTAQKRSERLQDVPISVDVVGASQLQQNQVRDFKDIMREIPGVSFSGADFGQSRYSIRGVSTNSPSPTVGIYLDDISLLTVSTNFSGAVDPVFFDINRVEVLKGPQGTLYGGSAMGGAIKYVSQLPNLSIRSVDLETSLSSTVHGSLSYDEQAVFNLPLVEDKFALRAGLLYRHDGGYVDNVADAPSANYSQSSTSPPQPFAPTVTPSLSTRNAKDQNSDNILAVKVSALWEPDPSWQVVPSVLHQDYHQANPGVFWTNLPDLASSFRLPQPTSDRLTVARLSIVKHLGDVDVTSLTGYVNRSVDQRRDYSFYVGALVPPLYAFDSPNVAISGSQTISEELRLSSSNPSARLRWVTGVYYSSQDERLDQTVQTLGAGAALGTGTDTVYFGLTRFTTEQGAIFADATYALLSKLDISIGLRAFHIRQTQNVSAGGLFNGGASGNAGANSETGVDPKFEVDYKATRDNMLYASAAKGFRPGGVNSSFSAALCQADLQRLGLAQAPTGFNSDSLWTYEAGSKNQFFSRRATLNAAVYYTDWSGIQQTILLPTCGFSFTGNVGAATIKGAELSGKLAISRRLVVGGSVNYADAQITKTAPGVSAQVGQPVLDTPKWVGDAFVGYTFELGADTADLRADYQYHGSQLRDFAPTYTALAANGLPEVVPNPSQYLKAYQVVNLNATWVHKGWEIGAFVDNLFDRAPIVDYNPTQPISQALTLRPRTFGMSLRTHFE